MPKLAYLGPEGTFTEEALRILAPEAERLPSANVSAALDAARRGEADGAVVPLENSLEGAITTTLDELAWGEPLLITAELLLPVEFSLLARPDAVISPDQAGLHPPGGHHPVPQLHRPGAARRRGDRRPVDRGGGPGGRPSRFAVRRGHRRAHRRGALRPGRARRRDRRPLRHGDPVRSRVPPRLDARARRVPTAPPWSPSSPTTIRARCWRCSPSSPYAAST